MSNTYCYSLILLLLKEKNKMLYCIKEKDGESNYNRKKRKIAGTSVSCGKQL